VLPALADELGGHLVVLKEVRAGGNLED
jgi:hypothetical protein